MDWIKKVKTDRNSNSNNPMLLTNNISISNYQNHGHICKEGFNSKLTKIRSVYEIKEVIYTRRRINLVLFY